MEHEEDRINTTHFLSARAKLLQALSLRDATTAAALLRVATVAREWFEQQGERLRAEAERRLLLGFPPGLRQLCGLSELEVPMNRVLGWIFDPIESHGAGSAPLKALAAQIGFAELEADLHDGRPVTVLRESPPAGTDQGRQPDLLIRTPRAALLLENKVKAPESGEGQYSSYLELLRTWVAWLMAPGGQGVRCH